jgi:HSP20 family protein
MALLTKWQPRHWMERWGPREDIWAPLEEMQRAMNRMWEDFARGGTPAAREGWMPSVDVYQEGSEVVVKAEAPGVAKEDLEVSIADGVVTVRGEIKKEEKVEEKGYYRQERRCGSFHREISLPADVKEEEAKATFKDGVLEVRIPKCDEAKVVGRKIEIA